MTTDERPKPSITVVEVHADHRGYEDHREICSFCAEVHCRVENNLLAELMPDIEPSEFLLAETQNFVVIPGVGSVCDGYVLIAPKDHVLSFGYLAEEVDSELAALFARLVAHLEQRYRRPVVAFEHGAESFRNRGGSCTDHAHMHVFPAAPGLDLATAVSREFELRATTEFLPALRHQVGERHSPYLWLRATDGSMHVCDAPKALSQYVRRLLVAYLGHPEEWDWAVFPGVGYMRATIRELHDHPIA